MHVRSSDEIAEAWAAQMNFLDVSVREFDAGARHEACRMAAATHLLVGRGQRNHVSICDSAGVQDSRRYRSSVLPGAQGLPLVACKLECKVVGEWLIDLIAMGEGTVAAGHDLPFDEWWDQVVVDTQGYQLTRRQLVLILRDKNGGAHFDVRIADPLTAAAIRGDISFQYAPASGAPTQPVPFLLETCMRQVAEELKFSFLTPQARDDYEQRAPPPPAPGADGVADGTASGLEAS
jgi:hypothetical protein